MNPEPLIVERADGVAVWRLNRPEALNALNEPLLKALLAAIDDARGDPAVRCVVVTGAGRAFSAGGDLKAILTLLESGSRDDLREYLLHYQRLSSAMRHLGKPLLAAINGHALAGGFELACLCDIRIAAETATFGLPDTPLGVRHAKLGLELAAEGNLQAALTYELDAEMACFAEAEVRMKLRAFANRRKSAGRTRKDT